MAITSGIVSYWKLEESSGTRVDSVGSNNLTDNNTVTSATGKIGTCASFASASTEYLSITDASQSGLDGMSNLSISMWVNVTTYSSERALMAKWNDSTAAVDSYRILLNGGTGYLYFVISNGTAFASAYSNTALVSGDVGNWVHLVFTWRGSDGLMNIYRNGATISPILSVPATGTINNSTLDFKLGAQNTTPTWPYNGKLDEVCIWNTHLDANDVSFLYKNYLSGFTPFNQPTLKFRPGSLGSML